MFLAKVILKIKNQNFCKRNWILFPGFLMWSSLLHNERPSRYRLEAKSQPLKTEPKPDYDLDAIIKQSISYSMKKVRQHFRAKNLVFPKMKMTTSYASLGSIKKTPSSEWLPVFFNGVPWKKHCWEKRIFNIENHVT